jgi:hypothetical protein
MLNQLDGIVGRLNAWSLTNRKSIGIVTEDLGVHFIQVLLYLGAVESMLPPKLKLHVGINDCSIWPANSLTDTYGISKLAFLDWV